MNTYDVLIVGAGPVGLLAGLLLAQQGIRILIVEQENEIIDSPRAVVYLPQVLGTLDQAGILDQVKDAGLVSEMGPAWRRTSDHALLAELDPRNLEQADEPTRPAILLGQPQFARIILSNLQQTSAEIHFNHSFHSLQQRNDHIISTLLDQTTKSTFTVKSTFVLGCDGGRSSVRKALSIPFEGFTHPLVFMAVNFRYQHMQATGFGDAQFMVDPSETLREAGFAVILRTGRDDVWRCAYGDDASFSDTELRARLPGRFQKILPLHPSEGEYEILQAQPYRIHQRCASTFTKGRALLAGDAAHLNNPTGGMGLNTGPLDAHAASVAISSALGAAEAGSAKDILAAYDENRRRAFTEFVNPVSIDNLRRLWEKSDEADQKLRAGFFERLNHSREFQRMVQLSLNKMGLGVPGFEGIS